MRKSSELKHVNGGKKTCYNFWPLCRLAWGQMKERHGWIISPLPLWRTVNLTVCWTSVILCLGVFPSKTQCLKPISDLQGEKAQNTEQILLLLNGVTVISFFFFSWNTFYCLVVVKFEMETQLWSEIVLLCVTELNRYSTTMCLLFFVCDTWNHWVAPNSWSSLCAVMKLCMVHIPRRLRFDKSIAR